MTSKGLSSQAHRSRCVNRFILRRATRLETKWFMPTHSEDIVELNGHNNGNGKANENGKENLIKSQNRDIAQ
jgi:hypothetical protein